jgi:hypothetical protein
MDVVNDPDTRDENSDELEPNPTIKLTNPGVTINYQSRPERKDIPAKSTKPLMMDRLRSYNADKQESASGKKSERDI